MLADIAFYFAVGLAVVGALLLFGWAWLGPDNFPPADRYDD